MSRSHRWMLSGGGLVVTALLAAPLAAAPQAPSPPSPPRAPVSAAYAPVAPTPPQAPSAPRAVAPPAPAEDALAPADPVEVEEWFGDVDSETLSLATDPAEWVADGTPELVADLDPPAPPEAPMAPVPGMMRGGPGMGGPGMGGPAMRARRMARMGAHHGELMEALRLSDSQKDKLADLRDRQRRDGIQARADLQLAALDLRKLLRDDRPDRDAIDAQIDKIAQRRAELRKGQIATMLEMREVLTPEQRETLKAEREKRSGDERTRFRDAPGGPGGDRRPMDRERRTPRDGGTDSQ